MHDIRPYLPELFTEPGDLLYIGFRPDACSWVSELYAAGNAISVLEIYPANVTGALGDARISRFWVGDVRQVDQLIPATWDYVFWWRGPEHVYQAELPGIVEKLLVRTKKALVVASPWGKCEQVEIGSNVHERHLWPVYSQDLEEEGFYTVTDGEVDKPESEIVGWIRGGRRCETYLDVTSSKWVGPGRLVEDGR